MTPWLSDRDLALQNVRYVLNAAGGLTEDFHPPRDGLIQTRARQVLGEAVDLLEAIVSDTDTAGDPPLLEAIADGTFGSMKRPADRGQGARRRRPQGRRLRQPRHHPARGGGDPMSHGMASREHPRRPDRAPLRRHHRRRHGAGVLHPAAAARQARRGRRAAARRQDGPGAGAPRARQGDGPGLHLLRRLRLGHAPRRRARRRGRRARVPAPRPPRRSTPRSRSACAASSSSSARASAPTPTPSASTPSSTSRASRGRRAWSTTAR